MGKKLTLMWLFCLITFSVFTQNQPNFYLLTSGHGGGTISKYASATNTLTAVHRFNDPNFGLNPYGSLTLVGGKFYGMTVSGGARNQGVIFSFDTATNRFTKLFDFDLPHGSFPQGTLTLAKDGKLYGTTRLGGNLALNGGIGFGTLFSFDPVSNSYQRYIDFNHYTGTSPLGIQLTLASDGKLWGMTTTNGEPGHGTLFVFDPGNRIFSVRYPFNGINGSMPEGNHLIQTGDGKFWGMTTKGGVHGGGLIFSYTDWNFVRYYSFSDISGLWPSGRLTPGPDGKFYGMTSMGGSGGKGTVFSFHPGTGNFMKIVEFNGTNGSTPKGSLTLASNGKLYGVTLEGGSNNQGVLFSIDPATNTFTKLQDFNGANGSFPQYTFLVESGSGGPAPPDDTAGECGTTTLTIRGTKGSSNFSHISLNSMGDFQSETNQMEMPAYAWTCVAQGYNRCTVRALFRYSVSDIPQNAVIHSAKLQLFAKENNHNGYTGSPMYGNNTALLQRVTSSWSESGTGWVNQPSTTTASQKILPQSTSPVQNYEIDVKDFVQTWVADPSQNFGMLLRMQVEEPYNSMVFHSGTAPDAQKPTLSVTYSVPNSKVVIRGTLGSPLFSQALLNSRGAFVSDTTQPEIPASAWTCNTFGVPYCQTRGLFRYDVRAVPANSVITSAKLYLYARPDNQNGQSGNPMFGSNNTSLLQKVISPWSTATVGWANQPSTTTMSQKVLPQSTSNMQNYVIDVTDFVQGWVDDPSSNYGMLLKLQTEEIYNSMVFQSGRAPDAVKPRLEICYAPAAAGANSVPSGWRVSGPYFPMPSENQMLQVFPNPATNQADVNFISKQTGMIKISITDASGKVIYSEMKKVTRGNNILRVSNLQKFSKGLYQVSIQAGEKRMSTKLVLN